MDELYCIYCGLEKGERLSCCGENHWVTKEEFDGYYDDDEEEENE